MDTYAKRATKAFSFLWAFLVLVMVAIGILLGAISEPAPDYFFTVFGTVMMFGGGVCGFLHGVTLSAARTLDARHSSELEEEYRG